MTDSDHKLKTPESNDKPKFTWKDAFENINLRELLLRIWPRSKDELSPSCHPCGKDPASDFPGPQGSLGELSPQHFAQAHANKSKQIG